MFEQFRDIGRDLFLRGLISSHGGNMSIRKGKRIIITRHGAMLGRLAESDLMEVSLEEDGPASDASTGDSASFDLPAHRAIYRSTDIKAVLHAHPPHALALSMVEDEMVLVELEASYLLKRIPVLKFRGIEHYAEDSQSAIPEALRDHLIVMVRGHGTYSAGSTLEDAYRWTSTLEENCRIVYLMGTFHPR
ncbi:MAG: class II aldolase/adducin family protein [Dehalococcoidia bacterium]|nr:class II aldolase/adducin family protein [Dehalococcoidia bacterium]